MCSMGLIASRRALRHCADPFSMTAGGAFQRPRFLHVV